MPGPELYPKHTELDFVYNNYRRWKRKMAVSNARRLGRHVVNVLGWLLLAGQMFWAPRLVTEDTACNCATLSRARSVKGANTNNWDRRSLRRLFETTETGDFPDKEEAQATLLNDPSLLEKLPDREFDPQAGEKMRTELLKKTGLREYLYATKKNFPVGATIPALQEIDNTVKQILPVHHAVFPEDIQLPNSPMQKCSVVLNGGILRGSRCGKEIDSSDYVFRDDIPPVTYQAFRNKDGDFDQRHVTYYRDVGNKTNFVALNMSHVVFDYFKGDMQPAETYLVVYRRYLKQYKEQGSLIWTHLFPIESETLALRALRSMFISTVFQRLGVASTMVTSHPRFIQGVQGFWKELNLRSPRASHGLIMTAISMALCEETHLYGVWPFPVDYEGRQVHYRYYYGSDSDQMRENSEYDFQEEFDLLRILHKRGLLKLHIGTCSA
ncbi:PREDICTED: alpha-2,8-sialyltransferase 8E-like [Branchiostoma belcheri]|uniref:Alpha-2,8-sialyltransferase 8E-like n=1 Tax=Branchiostoma belcheri TaxID=7741 RepID=A0A6P4XX50_BRABE|nr:PREDICTED: alpha-2,8-sialyltransferase 8E-like [Branchiostoma belcheri]